ncbi:MAG TPA: hypothetical protein PLK35_03675 [Candidatus Moranbacteria bacterium]|nr:hypothetical protein [Candidatus Moranbacteria bacterium]
MSKNLTVILLRAFVVPSVNQKKSGKKTIDVFCWVAVAACSLVACLSPTKEIVYGALAIAYISLAVVFILWKMRETVYSFCPHCQEMHWFWKVARVAILCPGCLTLFYKGESK